MTDIDTGATSGNGTAAERHRPPRRDIEEKLPRGLWVRLVVYVFAGHAVAGFLYLLFTLGGSR